MRQNPKEKDMKGHTNIIGKMPTRIQRSRKPGFRLPPNTVCINRGTKFGNPFTVDEYGREKAIANFNECLTYPHMVYYYFDEIEATTQYNRFVWMSEHLDIIRHADYIACFCPLDVACHGDILIEFSARLQTDPDELKRLNDK